jgi:hypothetical protein
MYEKNHSTRGSTELSSSELESKKKPLEIIQEVTLPNNFCKIVGAGGRTGTELEARSPSAQR